MKQKQSDPLLVTATELAERLRVHPQTIYTMTRKREIPSMRVGGAWRYDLDAVMAVLEREKEE